MPLVFIVLVVLLICVSTSDSMKKTSKIMSDREVSRRKTNATREKNALIEYMQQGITFDDAFKMTYQKMIDEGYDPCIPKDAYAYSWGVYIDKIGKVVPSVWCPERYDSFAVAQRRSLAIEKWKRGHPGKHITESKPEEIEELIYANFPTNDYEYLKDLDRGGAFFDSIPVGGHLVYPGLGTCEVLAIHWNQDETNGFYDLKVLKTGHVVSFVKITDKKIRRQGS